MAGKNKCRVCGSKISKKGREVHVSCAGRSAKVTRRKTTSPFGLRRKKAPKQGSRKARRKANRAKARIASRRKSARYEKRKFKRAKITRRKVRSPYARKIGSGRPRKKLALRYR